MDESTPTPRRLSKRKRGLLISLPFLLLLLCLGLLNGWARSVAVSPSATPVVKVTKTDTSATDNEGVATEPAPLKSVTPESETSLPTLAPTAVPPAKVTLIPQPTLPPTATITLLGPPDQSRIMAEDSITVYWTWPLPLAEDQYFGIYLQEDTGDTRVGRLEKANFGAGYRWQTEAQYLTDGGGEVRYLIKLETILTDTPLISSEPRTLFVLVTSE